jgi:hypothetical protein
MVAITSRSRSRVSTVERRCIPLQKDRPSRSVGRVSMTLLLAGLALGACAASNTPTTYDDVTSNNFITSCTAAGMDRSGCEQTYTAMSAPDGMPFDTFKAVNQQLAKDPTQMPADLETFLVSHPTTTTSSETSTPTTSPLTTKPSQANP